MRTHHWLLLLLFVASLSTAVAWRRFPAALHGEPSGYLPTLAAILVASVSLALLGRIVVKVSVSRRTIRRS